MTIQHQDPPAPPNPRSKSRVRSKAVATAPRSATEIRWLMLGYFHRRCCNSKTLMGKTAGASAVPISVVSADLKAEHGLTKSEVLSNLQYLLSQGWVDELVRQSQVAMGHGRGFMPSATSYYRISAAGTDKIEGPGEFTMKSRFHNIRIEASGRSTVVVGDGNEVNVRFQNTGEALAELRNAIGTSIELPEPVKADAVADIDTIQSQLAKRQPSAAVVQAAWANIERVATAAGLIDFLARAADQLKQLFPAV